MSDEQQGMSAVPPGYPFAAATPEQSIDIELLDWLAGQALIGLLLCGGWGRMDKTDADAALGRRAYEIASAMLAVRDDFRNFPP